MIALDPKQTFQFSLDIEAAKPEADRLKFTCHFLTGRQLIEWDQLTDQANAEGKPADAIPLLEKAIGLGLVEIPAKALSEDLTLGELWEVANKIGRLSRLTEIERKKSALQSASAAQATSAAAAQPAPV